MSTLNVAVAYYVSRQHQVGKHIRGETNVIAAVGTASERIPEIRMRILDRGVSSQDSPASNDNENEDEYLEEAQAL